MEFDPTNGIIGNRDLIRIAVARDPRQAIPLSGTWVGAPEDSLGMTVEVSVHEEKAFRPAGALVKAACPRSGVTNRAVAALSFLFRG